MVYGIGYRFPSANNGLYISSSNMPIIKGSPVGRPLICFTMDIADFSNFDRFVLGLYVNNRTGIATEDVPRQGPSSPQVSAKSAERLLS